MTSRKAILLIITLWFYAAATLGYFGFTRASEPFVRGPLVAMGIHAPYLGYRFSREFRHSVDDMDVSTITALHAWRLYAGFEVSSSGFGNSREQFFIAKKRRWVLGHSEYAVHEDDRDSG